MGAKEDQLASLVRADATGGVQRIHQLLVGSGLKYKGSKESDTLLYLFRKDGKEIGVAALRKGIFSFPAAFWRSRANKLSEAIAYVGEPYKVATAGFVSSSQYSAGQLRINAASTVRIEVIIRSIVLPEAERAGAVLTVQRLATD